MGDLRELIKPYRDRYGLVSPHRVRPEEDAASLNGVCYTGEYAMILVNSGQARMEDRVDFLSVIRQCQVEPGLFRRVPNPLNVIPPGPDDIVGLLAGSGAMVAPFAKEMIEFGRAHTAPLYIIVGYAIDEARARGYGWAVPILEVIRYFFGRIKLAYNFNPADPYVVTKHSWMGRQPQLIAHMFWAANEKPAWWRRVVWTLVVATSGHAPRPEALGQDEWRLSSSLVLTIGDRASWFERWAIRKFRERLTRWWPGGMGAVCETYYEPGHPFAGSWPT